MSEFLPCSCCKKPKHFLEFSINPNTKEWYKNCNLCRARKKHTGKSKVSSKPKIDLAEPVLCRECGVTKPRSEFVRKYLGCNGGGNYVSQRCCACLDKRLEKIQQRHREDKLEKPVCSYRFMTVKKAREFDRKAVQRLGLLRLIGVHNAKKQAA